MLDDLALFMTIVEAGSLRSAAQRQGLPTATMTRRLQVLEEGLGYRLLNRGPKGLTLTPEGAQYYEQCRPLIDALRQATQRLDKTLSEIAGRIRVLAPVGLASGPLAPAWASFLQRYPDISLELELSSVRQDLVGTGADLAIRVGALQDSALTQRRLGSTSIILVASPSYLQNAPAPANIEQLLEHPLLVAEPIHKWVLRDPDTKAEVELQPKARCRVNEMRLAITFAEQGLGILLCPQVQCLGSLQSGALVKVMPEWTSDYRNIYAIWSQQKYLPARVRALVEHLAHYIGDHPFDDLSAGKP